MPKVSIIVPVYNTESYLRKCLDSIINQTLKDIEIVCVNDGSTDSSADILAEYEKKDTRVKVVTRENGGLSAARNSGIQVASGDFIGFVDSDDYIDLNFYEKLYDAVTRNNCDIACATITRKRPNNQKYRVQYLEEKIYTELKDKLSICNIPKCCYVWNKIYRSEIVKNLLFTEGVFFEDVLWTPQILKQAHSMVTVPNIHYYYMVNSKSIVKSTQTKKKQQDSYNAKKSIIQFFDENGIELSKKERTLTKSISYIWKIPFIKVKEFENIETYYLLGLIPILKKTLKIPVIKDNTFFVWEPCSKSHSEVVPGYAKYLLDMGYHVSVLLNPARYKEGLFTRFSDENISYNKLTRTQTKNFFKNADLHKIKGVLVTTAGKICDCVHYDEAYDSFDKSLDKSKLFLVEHEVKPAVDAGLWREDIITLRQLNYKGAKATVVNPHYFGNVNITPKNTDIINFITIGAIQGKKKNNELIINAVKELHEKGYRNFKVTVVGKGNLRGLPKDLRPYFNITGRLPFDKMYEEIEKADFMLTSYNEKQHKRYNTTGTSGNFQLVYGFLKPCIIVESFAPLNGFDNSNSILYKSDKEFVNAMERGINMSLEDYKILQDNLKVYVDNLYKTSEENLKRLINGR